MRRATGRQEDLKQGVPVAREPRAAGGDWLDSAGAGRGRPRRLLGTGWLGGPWEVLGGPSLWTKGLTGCGAEGGVEESLKGLAWTLGEWGAVSEVGVWEEEQVEVSWKILGLGVGTELGFSGIHHALASLPPPRHQPPHPPQSDPECTPAAAMLFLTGTLSDPQMSGATQGL